MNSASFTLEGLNCASCASKIEERTKKLAGVSEASFNFATQEMKITYADNTLSAEKLVLDLKSIVHKLEPGVRVSERNEIKAHESKAESCACGHEHTHGQGSSFKLANILACAGVAVFAFALIIKPEGWLELSLFLLAYALLGWDVVLTALRNLFRGELFDENFLMSLATAGAFAIGEYPEAVAVMLFYKVGEYFQAKAVSKSRGSIKKLMDLKPPYANIMPDGVLTRVDPAKVAIGSSVVVLPGEKIPLDGEVIEGRSMLDMSSLTGESLPVSAKGGDNVLSGALNIDGSLTIRVTKDYSNSTVARILELVENASSRKAPTERFITKFSKIYTPVVVMLAVLLAIIPPLIIPEAVFADWLRRSLVFLVVSCPCALVISVPLSFFSGIGAASRKGILIKGGNYLQALTEINTLVFDKTGTLTEGSFSVTRLEPRGIDENEFMKLGYAIESLSNHPIARSFVNEFHERGLICDYTASDLCDIPGKGLSAMVNGKKLYCGNETLMADAGLTPERVLLNGTVIHIAFGGMYMGYAIISDRIRKDSAQALSALKAMGIKSVLMLTGDRKQSAEAIASEIGLDGVFAELLPNEKVEVLEELYANNFGIKIAFVGDGINDAPVLARCDIGFAMGGLGSDAAIEAADVVLMNDEPSKVAEAIRISRYTMKIVKQNIFLALVVKLIVLGMSVFGLTALWLAVFADVGVALIVVLNSLRIRV